MIYTLKNPIKNFPWGSRTAISEYFGVGNPTLDHQAELWMGAHASASSVIYQDGVDITLCEAITNNPECWLGKYAKKSSSSLPFLMKILAAAEPLSIQVHPSKASAELGFITENKQGIPLDAVNRNYKDSNHKPELVYALTPYLAMNGFRVFEQIIENFDTLNLPSLKGLFLPFKEEPSSSSLATFFSSLLALEEEYRKQVLNELLVSIELINEDHFAYQASLLITHLNKLYPEDIGLFAPLFLNIIELQSGEAMFLYAETPHAYIKGLGIEVMANSDNVLRAGLTPKHIDVQELVKNTCFEPMPFAQLLMEPSSNIGRKVYPIPVDDFKFDLLSPQGALNLITSSPEILLCLSGNVTIITDTEKQVLCKGDSVVLPASLGRYNVLGKGSIARAYC
jgi:mannose-6-phosphate isomerase